MRPIRNQRGSQGAALVGWLFADLLLALAMVFLVANASGIVVAIKPTPVPTNTPLPPTPTLPPCLQSDSHIITLNFAYQSLLNGDATTIGAIKQSIENANDWTPPIPDIATRQSGLVLIYVGAPNNGQEDATTDAVFTHIQAIVAQLGKQNFLFQRTAYHGILLLTSAPYGEVRMETYLFGINGFCPTATALP
jgi:hypothetical protein